MRKLILSMQMTFDGVVSDVEKWWPQAGIYDEIFRDEIAQAIGKIIL